jgi:uncharacterized membrane protein YraQ (UPF0718 family)
MENQLKNKPKSKKNIYFLISMVIIYIILGIFDFDKTMDAFKYALNIIITVIPILLFVYVFMVAMSFLNEKKLRKTIVQSPTILKYVLMSILGTLSHGPIYAWYPFLQELNKKGVSKGNVSSFLYARGIKLTLLPMLISFFDLKFAIILTIITFLFSIIQGLLIDLTEH